MTTAQPAERNAPVLRVTGASLGVGDRSLWRDLDLELRTGEFQAVLGPNGSGKTSLLRAILGLRRLDSGTVELDGRPVRRGDGRIGYIPQQHPLPLGTPLRGCDLVALGLDGHRFGPGVRSRASRRKVDAALAAVGATGFARAPVSELSGGEQQRLRVAQSLVGEPRILLCDEPLLSLDLRHQRAVAELIDDRRRGHGTPVVFVTHEINPVLAMVDRVLYLVGGRFRVGTPDEVLRSAVLSDLYGTPVEVVRSGGHVAVLGVPEAAGPHDEAHVAEDV